MKSLLRTFCLSACFSVLIPLSVELSAQSLKFNPQLAKDARVGYMPIPVKLSTDKPASVKKEPEYKATPKYATVKVGNGPKSEYVLAVDEPTDSDYKIYLDKNRNGDLTDDGDGAWANKREGNGRTMYGLNEYVLKASWGTDKKETSKGDYGLAFYRFVGQDVLLMYRTGGRTGEVKIDDKMYKAVLFDNDADGLYNKPLGDDGKPMNGGAVSRAVWLMLDLEGNGKWSPPIDVRSPFKVKDKAYVAEIAADGSDITIKPTTRKVPVAPVRAERPPLLAAGTMAPDFEAEAFGGGTLKLSDYRDKKIVILDFWATWCGPCMRSMPHLEKLYKNVKDKDVVVIALCVWDEKEKYLKWVPENNTKMSFEFAFDPVGRNTANSIATKLYKVSGIPTTYIIGKDGKIVEAIVGFSGDQDNRIETALKKLGVNASTEQ